MNASKISWPRLPSFKTQEAFQAHLDSLEIPWLLPEELPAKNSRLQMPWRGVGFGPSRKIPGNRLAIQPMEGWDATLDGRPTNEVTRRWQRFGSSGAKIIWGGEAMAVLPEGRANPNQLILSAANVPSIRELREKLEQAHGQATGNTGDLLIGFQLTHSGRFCRPNEKKKTSPRVAYRHPILDQRDEITDEHVLSDAAVEALITHFVEAAECAAAAGADFVDLKHCHGYLLHEFLSAHTRPGPFGGSFDNRTQILRAIVAGIRQRNLPISLGVRLSAFDFIPFRAAKESGRGEPEPWAVGEPYPHAFGINPLKPTEWDLSEPLKFVDLCIELGIDLLNVSAGSPYYNPHIQRPAAYPSLDGYQAPEDPLLGVARQIEATRIIKKRAKNRCLVVGSAYSYLQEWLPWVAEATVGSGWVDAVGLGRMALSYPEIFQESWAGMPPQPRKVCRTFSDCTTAPRNGLVSGCYPLDPFYTQRPEFEQLKAMKSRR